MNAVTQVRGSASKGEEFAGIQCLRFVAAMLVVLTHSTFYASERLNGKFPLFYIGAVGVDLFFVISGFVMYISSARLAAKDRGWIEFLERRFIRIIPLYWLVTTIKVAALILAPSLEMHSSFDLLYIIKSYLFIPARSSSGDIAPLVGVGWTLIFEMFFYAIFAFALATKSKFSWVLFGTVGLCIVASVFRTSNWPIWTFYLDPQLFEFIAGAAIAKWGVTRRIPVPVAIGCLAVGAIALFNMPIAMHGSLLMIPMQGIPAALIVFGLVAIEPLVAGRWPRWLVYAGGASYSLYLIHPMISPAAPQILARLGIHSGVLSTIASIIIALIGMMVVYTLFERPTTNWLKGLLKRSKPAAARSSANAKLKPVADEAS